MNQNIAQMDPLESHCNIFLGSANIESGGKLHIMLPYSKCPKSGGLKNAMGN